MNFLKLLTFLISLTEIFCCDFTFNCENEILKVHYVAYDVNIQDCINPSTTIPENENFGSVIKIILRNLNVPVLHKNFIANFTNVYTMELTKNKIKRIESESFNNLINLQVLDLSNNKINDLQSNFVANSRQLRKLILAGNQLTSFKEELLTSLPKLATLNLTYNALEETNSFGNSRLEVLDLSHNLIVKINETSFGSLTLLKYLDLSYNKIARFSDQTFVPAVGLKKLNLFHNNVSYLSPDVLKSLSIVHELIISFNPIPCNCYDEITKWSSKEGVLLSSENFVCKEIQDNMDVPVCVTTDSECTAENTKEDLLSILQYNNNNIDFSCRMIIDENF